MQPVPWVILVTGPPGSGKSSVGAALARHLGAALLDQDSMTNPSSTSSRDQLARRLMTIRRSRR
ncbi:AAA family ATPase [Ornithinimicrobium sp. INDO-MA30-4]|uniref:AAA family ATPase n=1 Tax=Ornithinimicrobium sp. INDO-MA30-4 TaxID=2908651 RepID=UPI001F32255A|nr:AAA family ATPase [Ornithinimicrobium sp. INDO-MA30-4]UJH69993.1 AAA family ATPase [Ornithinimicrobium sp. INDO-MA30-4]